MMLRDSHFVLYLLNASIAPPYLLVSHHHSAFLFPSLPPHYNRKSSCLQRQRALLGLTRPCKSGNPCTPASTPAPCFWTCAPPWRSPLAHVRVWLVGRECKCRPLVGPARLWRRGRVAAAACRWRALWVQTMHCRYDVRMMYRRECGLLLLRWHFAAVL